MGEDVSLVSSLPAGPVHVRIDARQLAQVIVNLAVNARDAMPDGGMLRVSVELLGEQPPRRVRLQVADDGCGMPPEIQARIFEPFFTTKPGRAPRVSEAILARRAGSRRAKHARTAVVTGNLVAGAGLALLPALLSAARCGLAFRVGRSPSASSWARPGSGTASSPREPCTAPETTAAEQSNLTGRAKEITLGAMSRLLGPRFAASPLAAARVLGREIAIISSASGLITIGTGAAAS